MKIIKYLSCILPLLFINNCSNKSDDLLNLILEHQNKYPKMEVQDVYKLLYQSVFGVKHLLKDTAMSHLYLIEEFNSVESKNEPLFENISLKNDVVRVNLKSFKYKNLSDEIVICSEAF